jgi:hypothetical protein
MDEPLISGTGCVPRRTVRTPRYFTYHASVLACLADEPGVRLRVVAARIGLTERAVTQLVADLVGAGVVLRQRQGRCNRYTVQRAQVVPATLGSQITIGALLALLGH